MSRVYAVAVALGGMGLAVLVAWPHLARFVLAFFIPFLVALAVTGWQADLVRRRDTDRSHQ